MKIIRKIKKIFKSKPTMEGAGVKLNRVFGYHQVPQFDPFLLLDDFHSDNPDDYIRGFPWHPHRGIETITYMLHGEVEHGDSLGNKGVISSGDVQWMTAGSGIIHQEMPVNQKGKLLWGFQLWANLPASDKMINPKYRDVKKSQIPEITLENDIKIKIISGKVENIEGPVIDVIIDPEYLDVTVPKKTIFKHSIKKGYTAFAYIIDGKACFEEETDPFSYEVDGKNYFDIERDCELNKDTCVLFSDGDEIFVSTKNEDVRFLLISGKPLNEPVAWYGPIVMNTQEELRTAFEEYQKGTFIKKK